MNINNPQKSPLGTVAKCLESNICQYADSRKPVFIRVLYGTTSQDFAVEAYRDRGVRVFDVYFPAWESTFDLSPKGNRLCIAGPQVLNLYTVKPNLPVARQYLGRWDMTKCDESNIWTFSSKALIKDIFMIDSNTVVVQAIDDERWPGDVIFVSLQANAAKASFTMVSALACQNSPSTRILLPSVGHMVCIISKDRYTCPGYMVSTPWEGPQKDTNHFDLTSWLTLGNRCHGESRHGFSLNNLLDNPTRVFHLGTEPRIAIWKNEAQELIWQPFSWAVKTLTRESMKLDDRYQPLTRENAPSTHIANQISASQIEFAVAFSSRTLAAFPRFDPHTRRSVVDIWDLDQKKRRVTLEDKRKNFWIGNDRWGFSTDLGMLKVHCQVGQDTHQELWLIP
ncbi:hypothetical protein EDB81DRAFT_488502 [Dactylonectria macrodidyma]|uniref:Uncharacterized protein n=1 Tax=Dactylonectria macrodidyma TaxID=307937 RepID=A0A9P9EW17_9HYPO|nr:hypothetical protein EDB81DRAFT_488502 [Dactylonectria macrodidyma]